MISKYFNPYTDFGLKKLILLDDGQKYKVDQYFFPETPTAEQDFKMIGLTHFFNTIDDNNIDWENLFDAKADDPA